MFYAPTATPQRVPASINVDRARRHRPSLNRAEPEDSESLRPDPGSRVLATGVKFRVSNEGRVHSSMRPLAEVMRLPANRGRGSARHRAWTIGETLGRVAARTELPRSGGMRSAQQRLAGGILEVGVGVDVVLHVTRRRG